MPRISDVPKRILCYIADYTDRYGFSPTIREICDGIGVCSSSTVHRHITRLKEQGLLTEAKPGSPRSLAISSGVPMDSKAVSTRHLYLQTADGGSLILDFRTDNGKLVFNGPIRAGSRLSQVIGCRELDEDAYYEAMAM